VCPPFGSGGGRATLTCGRRVGGPNSDEGTDTVVFSRYICALYPQPKRLYSAHCTVHSQLHISAIKVIRDNELAYEFIHLRFERSFERHLYSGLNIHVVVLISSEVLGCVHKSCSCFLSKTIYCSEILKPSALNHFEFAQKY
jgi:hypothetical protein